MPRPKKRGTSSRVYKEFEADDVTRKPKKQSAAAKKKADIIATGSEDQLREMSVAAAARRYKAQRADVFSKAQPATDKQRGYLRSLLDSERRVSNSSLIRFVEFANMLPSGHGTESIYDRSRIYLSRVYWIRAIEMALHGSNDVCSASDEVAISMGFDSFMDMEFSHLPKMRE